jgi:hypothetical protein
MVRSKPVEGHKFGGIQVWINASCECGWKGDEFRMEKGARTYAYRQWREHVAGHRE